MVNIIIFDIIFLDIYPALANAIIVFSMLMLLFNKELILEAYQKIIISPQNFKAPLKRKRITFGITLLIIVLIFTFDSFIEHSLGARKQKIIK